jgi:hypothetical protein
MTPISRREREISLGQAQTTTIETPWFPRRCFLTRKWLWSKPVVLAKRKIMLFRGDTGTVVNKFWIDPKEYTLYTLGKRTKRYEQHY